MTKFDLRSFGVLSIDLQKDIPFLLLVNQMRWYAYSVFYPSRLLKRVGLYPEHTIGYYPQALNYAGQGPAYSLEYPTPCYLDAQPDEYHLVEDFDRLSSLYEQLIQPFSAPLYEEAVQLMQPFLQPDARLLDLSCGPGAELLRLTQLVPEGEVIGVDLSAGMVSAAFEKARQEGVQNTAFFQADVGNLPDHFEQRFDVVYCSLAFHHYPQPTKALSEIRRVLHATGKAFILDPGPGWFNLVSGSLTKWGDPGWIGFYTGESFELLFRQAGFSDFYWTEILPGIGLSIGTK